MPVLIKELEKGLIFDHERSFYPSCMYGHAGGESAYERVSSYYFGYVAEGEIQVESAAHSKPFQLQEGMYFGLTGAFKVRGSGKAAIIERKGYRGLPTIGGPIEEHGRLLYIDHCRSSLLIPPQRMGEPCLNLLTFPKNIHQTMHIHPTVRLGIVASGNGECVTPGAPPFALKKGLVFMIEEGGQHCFHTASEAMRVIAFHPDTDWGPTDESHPMLNRTYRRI